MCQERFNLPAWRDCGSNSLPEIESPARGGVGKGVDAMTMNQGLIMLGERKIQEIRVSDPFDPTVFSKIRRCRPLDFGSPHIENYRAKGAGRSSLGRSNPKSKPLNPLKTSGNF